MITERMIKELRKGEIVKTKKYSYYIYNGYICRTERVKENTTECKVERVKECKW